MLARRLSAAGFAAVAILPALWALSLPRQLGLLVYPQQVAAAVFALAAAASFLAAGSSGWRRGAELALVAVSVWLGVHLWLRFPVLSEGAFFHPTESLILGIGLVVVALELLRRTGGLSLAAILAAMVAYALFSDLVPGKLQGRPIPPADILRFLGTDSSATLGAPLQVAAFVVVLYILFGRLLVLTGGAETLTESARTLAGTRRGATAKMAVIASGFMGSISGSAVSNVMSTGVVTIPAMKRAGFSAERAGAIEATASTGGQIMPPVMGAAAFLMAEYLNLPYQTILLAATIPAALYFYAVYLQIGLIAEKHGLGAGEEDPPQPWRALAPRAALVVVPMTVLLVALFAWHLSAQAAVVWASLALVALGLTGIGQERRPTLAALWSTVVETGRSSTQILAVCAVAGMIIGLLATSGLSFGLSFVLLQLGQGSLLALLLLTALVSIILGMGLPTTGVYLLLATLAAPPLIQLGVGALEAHFFVLYFGLLSMISPPVALAAFAAAGISGARPMATAVESLRFGWIAFLLPFVFVRQPELLMQGTPVAVATVAVATAVAVPLVTAALVGFGRRRLAAWERGAALALGLLAIWPHGTEGGEMIVSLAAAGAGVAAILWHLRRAAAPAAASAYSPK